MAAKKSGKGRMLGISGRLGGAVVEEGLRYGYDGAIVDVDPEVLERRRKQFGDRVTTYTSVEEAIAAHDDIVGAYIASPNRFHAEQAIALAPLNIPVFCEKPMGINEDECRRVIEAYEKSDGWLQIDFEYRFSPLFEEAHKIIQSGEVGDLRSIYFEYTPGPSMPDEWRLDTKTAGGMFGERLCHMLDLFRLWSQSEFQDIRVTAGPRAMPWYEATQSDNLSADFVMENGVYAHLQFTPAVPAMPIDNQYDRQDWTEWHHRLAVYLLTTEGAINLDIWKRRMSVIRRDPRDNYTPRIIRRVDYQHRNLTDCYHYMRGMMQDFVRRVHNGEGPRLDIKDSFQTMLAVFEADRQLEAAATEANQRFNDTWPPKD